MDKEIQDEIAKGQMGMMPGTPQANDANAPDQNVQQAQADSQANTQTKSKEPSTNKPQERSASKKTLLQRIV